MRLTSATALALAVAFAAPAAAATIQPVGVVASDTFWTYDVNNLINGSGLTVGLHDTHWGNMWQSTWDDVPHWLVFDLGQTVSLGGLHGGGLVQGGYRHGNGPSCPVPHVHQHALS